MACALPGLSATGIRSHNTTGASPMTLSAGTHLGRYEIRSKIDEGGMGEVYRLLLLRVELGGISLIKPETSG